MNRTVLRATTTTATTSINAKGWLLLAAAVTIIGWQFEIGRMILYPFTLLATYAHEMGHGLTSVLMGGNFQKLVLNPDGSGLAFWTGDMGRVSRGIIALGGLVGPSIAGALLLALSRKVSRARMLLYAIAAFMGMSLVLFARSPFAIAFIGASGLVIAATAHYAHRLAPFFVQLIGVQLCLSIFRDLSYMFSEGGVIDGVLHRSDSAAIAEALFLPYWFWGGIAAVFSFLVLALGLYVALTPGRTSLRG